MKRNPNLEKKIENMQEELDRINNSVKAYGYFCEYFSGKKNAKLQTSKEFKKLRLK